MVSTLRTPCAADQLLIEEVRAHEVLYACPTKSNKDNQLRDVAWQEIADTVGKTGKTSTPYACFHLATCLQTQQQPARRQLFSQTGSACGFAQPRLTRLRFLFIEQMLSCFERRNTVEEAKERWRYMRDKYVKELGRSRNGSANGNVETPPDASSFVGMMSFLNPFIKRK